MATPPTSLLSLPEVLQGRRWEEQCITVALPTAVPPVRLATILCSAALEQAAKRARADNPKPERVDDLKRAQVGNPKPERADDLKQVPVGKPEQARQAWGVKEAPRRQAAPLS